jgi:hypothetical protein
MCIAATSDVSCYGACQHVQEKSKQLLQDYYRIITGLLHGSYYILDAVLLAVCTA